MLVLAFAGPLWSGGALAFLPVPFLGKLEHECSDMTENHTDHLLSSPVRQPCWADAKCPALPISVRLVIVALAATCLASCRDRARQQTFSVGEVTYIVPARHVLSLTREPYQAIALKPPDSTFELVYDSRIAERVDRFGWPELSPLTYDPGEIERDTDGDLKIVCRRAVNPWGGCGFRIRYGGANWTVRFPRDQQKDARTIREKALEVLMKYRSRPEKDP